MHRTVTLVDGHFVIVDGDYATAVGEFERRQRAGLQTELLAPLRGREMVRVRESVSARTAAVDFGFVRK